MPKERKQSAANKGGILEPGNEARMAWWVKRRMAAVNRIRPNEG